MVYIFVILLLVFAAVIFLVAIIFRAEIKAAFERDPAARNVLEVILLYSGLHAIIFHRISRLLYLLKMPLLPRLISQLARHLTGIEIHPGAAIGKGLFIDHGMGRYWRDFNIRR